MSTWNEPQDEISAVSNPVVALWSISAGPPGSDASQTFYNNPDNETFGRVAPCAGTEWLVSAKGRLPPPTHHTLTRPNLEFKMGFDSVRGGCSRLGRGFLYTEYQ